MSNFYSDLIYHAVTDLTELLAKDMYDGALVRLDKVRADLVVYGDSRPDITISQIMQQVSTNLPLYGNRTYIPERFADPGYYSIDNNNHDSDFETLPL